MSETVKSFYHARLAQTRTPPIPSRTPQVPPEFPGDLFPPPFPWRPASKKKLPRKKPSQTVNVQTAIAMAAAAAPAMAPDLRGGQTFDPLPQKDMEIVRPRVMLTLVPEPRSQEEKTDAGQSPALKLAVGIGAGLAFLGAAALAKKTGFVSPILKKNGLQRESRFCESCRTICSGEIVIWAEDQCLA